MKNWKLLIPFALAFFLFGLFYWAIFSPKEDISERIYRTLKDQEGRADVAFKKVSLAEISDGKKFWQLEAEQALINKDSGLAALKETAGTFFQNNKATLFFTSPAALWDMKKKEIFLDKPLGYDTTYHQKIAGLKKAGPITTSTFNFSAKKSAEFGYWFQAKNLVWKLADQQVFCSGGILLNKGNVTGRATTLRGDVGFHRIELLGDPQILISADEIPATFEAAVFEISNEQNTFTAHGFPRLLWREAQISANQAKFYQNTNQLSFNGQARITYRDIVAEGESASYFPAEHKVVLSGAAWAEQAGNRLSGDQVIVLLKLNRIALAGRSKVILNE